VGGVSFLIQCLNAVQYGLLLFLVASGLTLVFGAMGVINLAHGSFYMVGAYFAYALAPWIGAHLHGGFFATLAVGLSLSIALGYALEWAFFSLLYEREHLQQVLMTYGFILVLEELRSILVGDDVHGVPVPAWLSGAVTVGGLMTYPVYRIFLSAACLVVALGLYLLLARTRLGMAIRAGSSNREMAQALGIDIRFLNRLVFAGGVALAVLAGMLAAPVSSVYPGMGGQVLILSFVVVVIGGIGSVRGAFIAALLVGAVDAFGTVFFPQAAGVLVYVTMAAVLLLKPEGLFRHA
jgi:branched-chain amino acid transport system permease protein